MVFHIFRAKGSLSSVLEWKPVLAKRFEENKRSREEHPSSIRSDTHGSAASPSWYCIREQLHVGPPSSRETELENRQSDSSGGAVCDEGLECSREVSWFGQF